MAEQQSKPLSIGSILIGVVFLVSTILVLLVLNSKIITRGSALSKEAVIATTEATWSTTNESATIICNSDSTKCDVYMTSQVNGSETYLNMIRLLDGDNTRKITIHISGYGGDANSAILIQNALRKTKTNVNCVVEAGAFSADAYIAASCKNLTVEQNAFLMFHAIQTNENFIRAFFSLSLSAMNTVLTQDEIDWLTQSPRNEIYLTADQVKKRRQHYPVVIEKGDAYYNVAPPPSKNEQSQVIP